MTFDQWRVELNRIILFGFVGGLAASIDGLIYFLLLSVPSSLNLGLVFSTLSAKRLSFWSGATVSFFAHRRFVFHSKRPWILRIAPFLLLYSCSMLANGFINETLLARNHSREVSWFLATGCAAAINFLGMKFSIFKD